MNNKQANTIIREIKDNYNIIAKDWNLSRFQPTPIKLKMLKNCNSMLDLGCGNGLVIPVVIGRVNHYTGVDISRQLINIAKKKYAPLVKTGQVDFKVADARKLPFKDNSFDFVISYAMLHHVPCADNQTLVLKEIFRVLKPGGEARIINWNLLNDWAYKRFDIKNKLNKLPEGFEKGDVLVPWQATGKKDVQRFIHIFTSDELKDLSHRAGFKRPQIYFYNRAGELIENGEEIVLKIKKPGQ